MLKYTLLLDVGRLSAAMFRKRLYDTKLNCIILAAHSAFHHEFYLLQAEVTIETLS